MTKNTRVDTRSSLVWLGDTTIQALHPYWNRDLWPEQVQHQPMNLCVSGETVGTLRARLDDGLLNGLEPQLIILNVGMNDLHTLGSFEVANGILDLTLDINSRHPTASVGIHALVPKRYRTSTRLRQKIEAVNALLRESSLPPRIRFIETYDVFVGAKRRFSVSEQLATVDELPHDSLDEWIADELDTISMDISESAAFDTFD